MFCIFKQVIAMPHFSYCSVAAFLSAIIIMLLLPVLPDDILSADYSRFLLLEKADGRESHEILVEKAVGSLLRAKRICVLVECRNFIQQNYNRTHA